MTQEEVIISDKKAAKAERKKKRKAADSSEDDVLIKNKDDKKEKKRLKKLKKEKKKQKKEDKSSSSNSIDDDNTDEPSTSKKDRKKKKKKKDKKEESSRDEDNDDVAESTTITVDNTATTVDDSTIDKDNTITLLLFYQYVEPMWSVSQYKSAVSYARNSGAEHRMTGRMRIAREGFNCTLTGNYDDARKWCDQLRKQTFDSSDGSSTPFANTDFKLTDHLPMGQAFPKLNCFEVKELVNYGLDGNLSNNNGNNNNNGKEFYLKETGTHLEPQEYHDKMTEQDTVIIDVRNHYENAIGHFAPPTSNLIDPMMRKSTEFPLWLDRPETKAALRNKQVLMYCTGGVRCERASALLRHKMETEPDTQSLNIKGVFQLQGGVDKYFKEFPDGGHWRGKNYTFDKRFAHAPENVNKNQGGDEAAATTALGRCESCAKPWDMYRGKRRCPTCGVPSLICRDCFDKDKKKIKKLDKMVRCELCVKENVTSKLQMKRREIDEMEAYAEKQRQKKRKNRQNDVNTGDTMVLDGANDDADDDYHVHDDTTPAPNPNNTTRLFVKNMCVKTMDKETLCKTLGDDGAVTHLQWLNDHKTGKFYGSAFVEMATPEAAAIAVARDGRMVLGRNIKIKYQQADGKDLWPPANCALDQLEE